MGLLHWQRLRLSQAELALRKMGGGQKYQIDQSGLVVQEGQSCWNPGVIYDVAKQCDRVFLLAV